MQENRRSRMSNETVLVTGASSGIGLELARLFAADGAELILVARRTELLNQLAEELHTNHGTTSTVISLDLSEPDAPQRLYDEVTAAQKQVDVLVNNAGFGQLGRFVDVPLERHLSMIQVNIAALTHLTYLFLPQMRERRQGAILNLGSTAAFQPGPNSAVYYATKAYVLSFSEALSTELRRSGVSVTCLCPGPTRTGFGEDSDMEKTLIFRVNSMSVASVARAGYRGVRRRRRLVMPGIMNNLLSAGVRISPRYLTLLIMRRLQRIP